MNKVERLDTCLPSHIVWVASSVGSCFSCPLTLPDGVAGDAIREDESLPVDEEDNEAEPLSEISCEVSTPKSSTQPPQRSTLTKEEISSLGLRYFTPSEVARLHSFPESFSFPEHVTLRQQYALLGNSVSALVIGDLLRYLLPCSGF